jgi:ribulose kinase
MMRQFKIALVLFVAMSAPVAAQDMGQGSALAPVAKVSAWRVALSEIAIARYRAALKLTAAQEKYWPAVASALRTLARLPQIDETAVRRVAPSVSPLLATLDDHQKQVAMGLVQQAGLAQYASLF